MTIWPDGWTWSRVLIGLLKRLFGINNDLPAPALVREEVTILWGAVRWTRTRHYRQPKQ